MALPVPPAWARIIASYEVQLRASARSSQTIRARREQLQHLARRISVEPSAVTAQALLEYVGSQPWQSETRRSRYSGFREFFKWAKRNGHIPTNPAKHLPRVKASEPNPDPVPHAVYTEARRAAIIRGDERALDMMEMAYDHGMRRTEIAVSHSDDLREDLLGWSLIVHGKGGKKRVVPLTPRMALRLRARGAGYFFPGDVDGHLSPRRVGEILRDALPGHWTGHKLRHSFGTNVHEVDGDVMITGKLLGHANLSAVPRYVRPSDERMRATVYAAAGYTLPQRAGIDALRALGQAPSRSSRLEQRRRSALP